MGADTNIEWCDHSWSPWRGCTKVSAGCAHCYAETLSKRNPAVLGQWGKGKPRVKAKNWNEPRKWNNRVFAGVVTVFPSLCDWLDDEVPVEWLAEFLQLIHDTPNLTWLLLTKRPELWSDRLHKVVKETHTGVDYFASEWLDGDAPTNVWVGTSVEDQANADRRIPELLKIPARGRFLSLEPLLGPVDMREVKPLMQQFRSSPYGWHNWLRQQLHWLIIGGESGPGARPCNVEWIRSLVRQGKAAGVPTFVKQLGANSISEVATVPDRTEWRGTKVVTDRTGLVHPKGGDPAEWPEDLRVREFPAFGGAQ